jgi:ubiquitin C-terminal hydrolase
MDAQIKKAHDDWIYYYKNKHSVILDLFGAQLRTGLTCANCHKTVYNYDPLMVIDLPIILNADIYQCLDKFILSEQLSSDNMYTCDNCHSKTCAQKQQYFWNLPEILIIKFNRFEHKIIGNKYISNKVTGMVTYPVSNLDLSKYVCSPFATHNLYDLFAVCCHVGTMHIGHYFSFCYNTTLGSWCLYDDTRSEILEHAPVTDNAYILFYRKTG